MPWLGFEPRRLTAPPPQDGVSTSFTTRAIRTKPKARNGSAARPVPEVLQQRVHRLGGERITGETAQRLNDEAHLCEIHAAVRALGQVGLEPLYLGGWERALDVVSH